MLIDFRNLFPKYNINPKGVLHVGANVGEEAPIYNQLGIKKVLWIEGNGDLIQKLAANISQYEGQTYMNYLIGDDNSRVKFHISNNSGQSSSILELGTHLIAHPDVKYTHDIEMTTFRIDDLFTTGDLNEYDFLNIDLQGAELKALKGMGRLLYKFQWAYLEVNKEELYKGCALVGEIDEYMNKFGFKRVETKWCGNTGWGDALYIK